MWCKNCKTSLPGDTKICPVCGAAVKTGRKAAAALLCMLFAAAVVGGVYLYGGLKGREAPEANPNQGTDQAAPADPTANPDSDAPTEPEDGDTETESQTSVYAALSAVAKAAPSGPGLVSRNGFLYDNEDGMYVTFESIEEAGLLDASYMDASATEGFSSVPMLLYLRSGDAAAATGRETAEEDAGLSVGTAAEVPDGVTVPDGAGLSVYAAAEVSDGVAVADGAGFSATVYRETFNALLSGYQTGHGDIRRPGPGDADYDGVLALALAESGDGGATPRYLALDTKYAVCVLALDGGERLSGMLFVNNGEWQVSLAGIEEYDNISAAVNAAAPDMDLALLPGFDIKGARFTDLVDVWAYAAGISGEPYYASGCDQFAYVVAEEGSFLLMNTGNNWAALKTEGWEDALSTLEELDSISFSYILLQG